MQLELAVKRRKVQEVVNLWLQYKVFTMNSVKRALQAVLGREGGWLDGEENLIGMSKPEGTDVLGMYHAGEMVFECGESKLPDGIHHLSIENMRSMHVESCVKCREFGVVKECCYFYRMIKCVENGWKVPVDEKQVRRKYKIKEGQDKNYGSVGQYYSNFEEEFNKMRSNGVLMEVEEGFAKVVSPMSAVIKGSDINRAKVLVGIDVKNEESLALANNKLKELGFKKIKTRAALDVTATGINDASPKPPFRYPSLQDGLKLVSRGCWLGKTDVERYFLCFPLAQESYPWFVVYFASVLYCFVRAMFGYGPCPYYTSTWIAEFYKWVRFKNVPAAFMVDDWLTRGSTESEARYNLGVITSVFVAAGFVMATDKEEVSQRLTFLGVMIDTVRMCISFDETQARSMVLQLLEHTKVIEKGYDLDETTIRSVAGKLQWYSEVLQSGRVHLRSWWLYVRYRSKLTPVWRSKLLRDTRWWVAKLEVWSRREVSGVEYPIVSAEDLLNDPSSIAMMISDASGTDGFGYYYGSIFDVDFRVYARKWGSGYEFHTSHTGELQALRHYLSLRFVEGSKVLLWVTDSLSAVFSVNKGRCREESGLRVLEEILEMCDMYKVQLIALWIPRENNIISDYLSHLCAVLGRDEYEGGSLRDIPVFKGEGETGGGQEVNEGSKTSKLSLPKLVYKPGMEFIPKGLFL